MDDPAVKPAPVEEAVEPEKFAADPDATWTYWTDSDTADRGVPEEWIWDRLRLLRNQYLESSDKWVIPDAPVDIDAWIEYRQALRDLPASVTDPRLVIWPAEPTGNSKNTNRLAIEDAAKAAMIANREFLASTPNQAAAVAQVKALTRQVNALIRLALRDISNTD